MPEFKQREGTNGITGALDPCNIQERDRQVIAIDHPVIMDFGSLFQIDRGLCDGCGLCSEVCPADIIAIEQYKAIVPLEKVANCYECGSCMSVCMKEAIFRI